MADVQLRAAREADIPAVARIAEHYILDTEEQESADDVVLGYAYAGYRFTAELSIFCDPAHTGRAIGTRLLTAILAILRDPASFLASPGYGGSYPAGVAPCAVRHLLAVMSVDETGKRGGLALKEFYEGFGFVLRGHLQQVGYKFGRWIDTMALQYSFY